MDPIQTRLTLQKWVDNFMSTYPAQVTVEYEQQYPQDERTLLEVFVETTTIWLDRETEQR